MVKIIATIRKTPYKVWRGFLVKSHCGQNYRQSFLQWSLGKITRRKLVHNEAKIPNNVYLSDLCACLVCVCVRERKSEWAKERENARLRIYKWTDVSDNKIAAILNYCNVAVQGSEEQVVFPEFSRSSNGLFVYVISVITILVFSFCLCVVVLKTWIFREVRRNSFDIWKIFRNRIKRRKNFAQIWKFTFKGMLMVFTNRDVEYVCVGVTFFFSILSRVWWIKRKHSELYTREKANRFTAYCGLM